METSSGAWARCSGTFNLPESIPARKYIGEDNKRRTVPVMVHRALFGSIDVLRVLIEHYAGRFPCGLRRCRVVGATDSESHQPVSERSARRLADARLRVEK